MGYTHYFRRAARLDRETFAKAAADCARLHEATAHYIPLGDGCGEGEPAFDRSLVLFNGSTNCGHPKHDMGGLPWPAPKARGVATFGQDVEAGSWYAGVTLAARICDGDCSYEGFEMTPNKDRPSWDDDASGLVFDCCKTAFRPYDLMVQACLVVFAHYFGTDVLRVTSDGDESAWADARRLCRNVLGYGEAFRLYVDPAVPPPA